MKKIAIATLLLFVVIGMNANYIYAQKARNNRMNRDCFRCVESLNLTQEQSKQIDSLVSNHRAEMDKLRTQGNNLRAQRNALRDEHQANIEKLLTDEQKQKLTKKNTKNYQNKRKNNMRRSKRFRNN
ncbi:MAG: hypothetical protein GX372_02040 [Ignavibacteria bacterium]|nr:hypothetical protein [Ignavibacteria bacterium]